MWSFISFTLESTWINLISLTLGNDALFQYKAQEGDADYAAFWDLVLNKREEAVYSNMEEGLKFIQEGPVVIYVSSAMLKGYFRENPFHQQELKIFGKEKPTYSAVVLTRNSPLKQVFTSVTVYILQDLNVVHFSM